MKLVPPPCLQQLVEAHGGYHRITPEAWAQYDRDVAKWREDLRSGALWMDQWMEIRRAAGGTQKGG